MSTTHEITGLLRAWHAGDETALQRLTPVVYADLHRAARHYMAGENRGHVLQSTALIHETYLRLVDQGSVDWQSRSHFFAICAQVMRQILTDYARSRRRRKRSGNAVRVNLDQAAVVSSQPNFDFVALDEAMRKLAAFDKRKSRVVEMRFFGGLGIDETAEVLKISPDTVMRDWKFAKMWLLRELKREHQIGT